MSANVWFEEVNKGLINEILKTVRIKNSSEDLVPLQKEAVIVRKPEEDFKLELLPCISIYNLSYKHDSKRYNPEPLKVTEDEQNHLITLEEPAVSFNLDYQLDFWSEYMIDMDVMTGTWLSNHFRQFNLKVIDDGGKERSCNCLTQRSVIKSDLLSGGKRLFHSIIRLTVWVELDNENRYSKPMVTNRGIKTDKD